MKSPTQRERNLVAPEDSAASEIGSPGSRWGSTGPAAHDVNSRRILVNAGRQTVHVGESSLLVWLLNDKADTKQLHHTFGKAQSRECNDASPQFPVSACESLLTPEMERELLESFCRNFLPLYPIVNEKETLKSWSSGTIPPLLKYSILVIGVVHAPASVLRKAEVSCKQDAIDILYQKARQIYDNDDEVDRVCVVQSMFMLQFRFGLTASHRDCFWWAGGSANLAQTVGMHRSTKGLTIEAKEKRLWKKIWWQIYVSWHVRYMGF